MTTTHEPAPGVTDDPGTGPGAGTGGLRIDLGCGDAKRPGFVGVDHVALPGVDHVLDLLAEPLPVPDDSVDEVFSAHFFEHIAAPDHVLGEIGRVCREGARIEIWTPYAFSANAFVYGHLTFFTEVPWLAFCVHQRDTYLDLLKGRWDLHRVTYVVHPDVQRDIEASGTPVGFAIRYWKGVVTEMGVEMTYHRDLDRPAPYPTLGWRNEREGTGLTPLTAALPATSPPPATSPAGDAPGGAEDRRPTPVEAVGRRVVPRPLRQPLRRGAGRLGLVSTHR